MSRSNRRARRRPSLIWNVSSMKRVVDEALPAERGARLFEIDPHHDAQVVAQLPGRPCARCSAYSSPAFGSWIEQGPTHDEQAIILTVEDLRDLPSAFEDDPRRRIRDRHFLDQNGGREQRSNALDSKISRTFHERANSATKCAVRPRGKRAKKAWNQGTSTVDPVVRRASRSACARPASRSGYVCPT